MGENRPKLGVFKPPYSDNKLPFYLSDETENFSERSDIPLINSLGQIKKRDPDNSSFLEYTDVCGIGRWFLGDPEDSVIEPLEFMENCVFEYQGGKKRTIFYRDEETFDNLKEMLDSGEIKEGESYELASLIERPLTEELEYEITQKNEAAPGTEDSSYPSRIVAERREGRELEKIVIWK